MSRDTSKTISEPSTGDSLHTKGRKRINNKKAFQHKYEAMFLQHKIQEKKEL